MSETTKPGPLGRWMSDKIVSESRDPGNVFRDDSGFSPDRQTSYLRLQFVTIFVRDQDRSLRFFVDKLGFSLVSDTQFQSGNRWIVVAPPDGTAGLALVVPIPGMDQERLVGQSHSVTFIAEDVVAKHKELSERGVTFSFGPQNPTWGGVFCRFEDPDGNQFVLAGFDEVTREIEERRRAFAERKEAERYAAQELEIAKHVQARLFPQRLPAVPDLDYAGLCMQARSVGGDYYDFLDLGGDRIALIIGDIAGKGMAAALLMANLQANLRSQCVSATDHPEAFLGSVNRQLFENTSANGYATLFFSDYDHRTGQLRYANCGHLAALILRCDGTIEKLEPTCTVVGLFEDWQCAMAENRLEPGDCIALYTDGVTESPNIHDEEFGEERLIEALRRFRELPAQQMAAAVVDEVVRYSACEQFDDITLIIARRASKRSLRP